MFKRLGLTTLILGSVLALVPASGFAGDRDNFYHRDNAYPYSRNEYVSREKHESREHARRDLRERRWERGHYGDRYDTSYGSYSNTYYDRHGNWNRSRY